MMISTGSVPADLAVILMVPGIPGFARTITRARSLKAFRSFERNGTRSEGLSSSVLVSLAPCRIGFNARASFEDSI